MPVEELIGESQSARATAGEREAQAGRDLTRRAPLLGGAGALAGAALASAPARSLAKLAPRASPRIAIVGAGLAGARC